MKRFKSETGWAIAWEHGLYIGWWLTRKEAIKYHTESKVFQNEGISARWKRCYRNGDRAIKVRISQLEKQK